MKEPNLVLILILKEMNWGVGPKLFFSQSDILRVRQICYISSLLSTKIYLSNAFHTCFPLALNSGEYLEDMMVF